LRPGWATRWPRRYGLPASLHCGGSCGEGVPGLRQAVAALVRDDFANGETVLVEGWVLARAEAETLALISLNQGRSC
jgi:hypothetical protein